MPAGYSGTPLAKKLGIKAGFSVLLLEKPSYYFDLFSDWPDEVNLFDTDAPEGSLDFVHLFCTHKEAFEEQALLAKKYLKKTGMLWVSWPKGKSSIPTDLKRDPIREFLLAHGLVDIKVAAVDEDWSGLKFMYRVKDR